LPGKLQPGRGLPEEITLTEMPMPGKSEFGRDASNLRAPITHDELREVIEEGAWLRARRAGRLRCSEDDWAAAEAEILRRLGAES